MRINGVLVKLILSIGVRPNFLHQGERYTFPAPPQ